MFEKIADDWIQTRVLFGRMQLICQQCTAQTVQKLKRKPF